MQDSERDTDIKNRLLDSVGEGDGGMIWENGIETCIILYAAASTSKSRTCTGRERSVPAKKNKTWEM